MNKQVGSDNNPLEQVMKEVRSLQEKVEHLSARIDSLEGVGLHQKTPVRRQVPQNVVPQEGVLSRVDQGALLPRIAAVCFMLVVALILRTITDNQIIGTQIGSVFGMVYAAVLIISGWFLYKKRSRFAPVFSGCGLLLLFSIVIETHSRYQSLSTFWAYMLLFGAGGSVVVMSLRHQSAALVCLGTLGTFIIGIMIDFPYPYYPALGGLLLAANYVSFLTHRRRMCLFLRYAILGFTGVFWLFWSFKLNIPAACDEPTAALLNLSWFFPVLICFWGMYFIIVVLNVLKKDLESGFYEALMPTIAALGAYSAGWAVVVPWYGKQTAYGMIALSLGIIHFFIGWWLAVKDREGAAGSNAFVFAGICLIVLGTVTVMKNNAWVLPLWSAIAFILALLSRRYHSGGIRVSSYLLQLFACLYAIISGVFSIGDTQLLSSGIAAAVIATICLLQYRWSRKNLPPGEHSAYFSWLDKKDVSAVVLLITGLVSSYYFVQFASYGLLSKMFTEFVHPLQSAKSICINAGAVLLMIIALSKRSREIVIVAGVVALMGAFKVFILDLFTIKGISLVASVFSIGIVAAVASVVMGRWQKRTSAVTESEY